MLVYAAESDRLWLQPLSLDEHLDDYHLMMSNPQAMSWSTRPVNTDPKQTAADILDSMPTPEKPWNRRYAILLRPDPNKPPPEADQKPKMIGILGTPREFELAYKLHPDYWGKGYMSEAVRMFIKLFWQLEEVNPNTILIAYADSENSASLNVLDKAGFQRGPVRKEFYERAAFKGVKKSDLQSFHLERPKDLMA